MTKRQDRDAIYVKRQFDTEIIVLCVRWYITYRLSYRDLVAMMAERGVIVSHTTIMRWVIRYVPEFEKRWNRFARSIGSSWRVDETYSSDQGQMALSVPSRAQARAQHRLHAATGSGHCRCAGVLSEGARLASGSSPAKGYTRWPCTEPPGVATLATRAPCLAPSQSSQFKVPEQHH
jgi:hypothetical protein